MARSHRAWPFLHYPQNGLVRGRALNCLEEGPPRASHKTMPFIIHSLLSTRAATLHRAVLEPSTSLNPSITVRECTQLFVRSFTHSFQHTDHSRVRIVHTCQAFGHFTHTCARKNMRMCVSHHTHTDIQAIKYCPRAPATQTARLPAHAGLLTYRAHLSCVQDA